MSFSSLRQSVYSRFITFFLLIAFIAVMNITPRSAYAQEGILGLPQPGTMVNLSPTYRPLQIIGMTIHPENPLLMDFIVNTGNTGMDAGQVKTGSDRLIKYFLACLTIPENNQWVNLSPYEKDRIIPDDLGQTVLGQDMLAQDYLLKQLTASLIYPEKNLGKNFWDKVYAKASQMYGTTQIPVNTFNKVWILPDTAQVYEHKDTVFVVECHLKVMLDEDYLALNKHSSSVIASPKGEPISARTSNSLGSQMVRQIILPAIEQEVNTGKNFAQLRQIYNSMVLAFWFKNNLKQALLNQVYTGKSKVNGIKVDDPAIKNKIYQQYLQAYKKGVFNYIKEDKMPCSFGCSGGDQIVPRKYFSGGLKTITSEQFVPRVRFTAAYSGLSGDNFKLSSRALSLAMITQENVTPNAKFTFEKLANGEKIEVLARNGDNVQVIMSNTSGTVAGWVKVNSLVELVNETSGTKQVALLGQLKMQIAHILPNYDRLLDLQRNPSTTVPDWQRGSGDVNLAMQVQVSKDKQILAIIIGNAEKFVNLNDKDATEDIVEFLRKFGLPANKDTTNNLEITIGDSHVNLMYAENKSIQDSIAKALETNPPQTPEAVETRELSAPFTGEVMYHVITKKVYDESLPNGVISLPKNKQYLSFATAQQVLFVANKYLSKADALVVLRVPTSQVNDFQIGTDWETGQFPHYYDPLPTANISKVMELTREGGTPNGKWQASAEDIAAEGFTSPAMTTIPSAISLSLGGLDDHLLDVPLANSQGDPITAQAAQARMTNGERGFLYVVKLKHVAQQNGVFVGSNDRAMKALAIIGHANVDLSGLNHTRRRNLEPADGGIDLNSRTLNMTSYGQKVNITFNQGMIAQFRRGNFSGVQIEVLKVVPMSLLPY